MADISMCLDADCPMSEFCYRYTAKPNERRQSYMQFTRDEPDGSCSSFMPNKLYREEHAHDPR
jgi:hypothetical protein